MIRSTLSYLCEQCHNICVICFELWKGKHHMTELKATAPASDTEKVLNREKYLVFNHYRNAIYVRYRINGTYPVFIKFCKCINYTR